MATTYSATKGAFCNSALKLLRQDTSISNFTGSPVAVKCGDLYELAYDAVATPLGLAGSSDPTDTADKRALVYALARELALPVTGRLSDFEAMDAAFSKALGQAVRKKIEASVSSGSGDAVLAMLVKAYAGRDEELPTFNAVYTTRKNAVHADSENTVKSILGIAANTSLTGAAKDAAIMLSVAKLAQVCGLDASFAQLKVHEYEELLKRAFAEGAAADPSTASDSSAMGLCLAEVRKTLEIPSSVTNANLDALVKGAAQALYYSRYGERAGYEANFTEAKLLVYKSKLLEWRRVKLAEAAKEDPVLLTVLPSFAENDAALANGYAIYSAKRSTIEDACVAEINAAHGWATAFAVTGTTTRVYPTTHPAYPAFLYLCATRLAPVCGASPYLVALIGQKYSAALGEAKVKDFEAARAAETDTDLLEAFALVRQYVLADGAVPWGWASVKAAYERIREGARRQVLEYYGWSFCRRAVVMAFAPPAAPGGEFTAAAPGDCARVLEAFDANGESLPVVMRGSVIYSRKPAFGLLYVADEELDEWPVTLRKAYVATLAATLAASMPTHDAQGRYAALVQYREETLSLARQADARQNRADYAHAVTGNRYTKAARGEDGRFPSVRGGFRHG